MTLKKQIIILLYDQNPYILFLNHILYTWLMLYKKHADPEADINTSS